MPFVTARPAVRLLLSGSALFVPLLLPLTAANAAETVLFRGVLASATGTPVAGVQVRVESGSGSGSGSATTTSSGAFELRAPVGSNTLTLSNFSGSFGVRQFTVNAPINLNQDTTQNLTVPTPVTITTTVLNAGQPVQGATVTSNSDSIVPFEIFPGTRASGRNSANSTTDSAGKALLQVFPTRNLGSIDARQSTNDGTSTANTRDVPATTDQQITLDLPRTVLFRGVLASATGTPVAGVQVRVESGSGSGSGSATTTSSGAFELRAPVGSNTLTLSNFSGSFGVRQFTVNAPINLNQDTTQNLTVPTPVTITTTVLNAGQPVQGATVTSNSDSIVPFEIFPGTRASGRNSANSTTDSAGKALLQVFPTRNLGSIDARQSTNDGTSTANTRDVPATTDQQITLDLPRTVLFRGVLASATGTPVAGVQVRVESGSGSGSGSATTTSSGAFELRAPVGSNTLTLSNFSGSFGVRQFTVNAPINLNQDTTQNLTVPTPVTITTTVLNAGQPVQGATVTSNSDSIVPFEIFPGTRASGRNSANSTTDSAGKALLQVFPTRNLGSIDARQSTNDGTSTANTRDVPATTDQQITLDLVAGRPPSPAGAVTFSGVLRDATGAAVAGALVGVSTGSGGSSASTTSTGRFELQTPAGSGRLTVRRDGFGTGSSGPNFNASAPITLTADTVQDLTIPTAVKIAVTVQDAAGPVSGAFVSADSSGCCDGSQQFIPFEIFPGARTTGTSSSNATTDSTGKATLQVLPSDLIGRITANHQLNGSNRNASTNNVPATTDQQLTLTLPSQLTFSGVLRDATGAAVAGALVGVSTGSGGSSASTTSTGRFELQTPVGSGRLTVRRDGFGTGSSGPNFNASAPITLTADTVQDLTIPTAVKIAVTVQDAAGPVSGAFVSADSSGCCDGSQQFIPFEIFPGARTTGTSSSNATTDSTGKATLQVLPSDLIGRITANHQLNGSNRNASTNNVPATTDQQLTLTLPSQLTFSGVLRDATGAAVAGALVGVSTGSGGSSASTTSTGRFELQTPVGSGRLTVRRDGFGTGSSGANFNASAPITLTADTVQDLTIPTAVKIAVTVQDAAGPVSGAFVSADSSGCCDGSQQFIPFEIFPGARTTGTSSSNATTDSTGKATLQVLPSDLIGRITANHQLNGSNRNASTNNVPATTDQQLTLTLPGGSPPSSVPGPSPSSSTAPAQTQEGSNPPTEPTGSANPGGGAPGSAPASGGPVDSGGTAPTPEPAPSSTNAPSAAAATPTPEPASPSATPRATGGSEADGSTFVAVAPERLLDTRGGLGAPRGTVGPASTISLKVTGTAGVPTNGVTAVVLNLTSVGATSTGYVTAYPTGQPRPEVSNLNTTKGLVTPNLVVVKVGTDGKINLYNNTGSTHLLADIAGYYASTDTGSQFTPSSPERLLDTRTGLGAPRSTVGPASTISLKVTGTAGVPTNGVTAVVLNLTSVGATSTGYVTAYPTGQPRPEVSNLNTTKGLVTPNLVVVKVGTDGKINLYNNTGSTHLLADIAGYYASTDTGSQFTPSSPERLLDTRTGLGAPRSTVGPASTISLKVTGTAGVPTNGVTAVVLNLTSVGATSTGYVTAYPTGQPRPEVSNLNTTKGLVTPNLVVVKVGTDGKINLYNNTGSTHLLADIAGYYTA